MPISLFYWYTEIADVQGFAGRLGAEGERLRLGGRMRVSGEGINGTVGGDRQALEEYHSVICDELSGAPIDFKVCEEGGRESFNGGLRVRVCREVEGRCKTCNGWCYDCSQECLANDKNINNTERK